MTAIVESGTEYQSIDEFTILLFGRVKLTLSQTSPGFYESALHVFENTLDKGDIACNKQFLLFPLCFLPV